MNSATSLKKISAPRFFTLIVLISLASNFVHPVTPTLFQNLGLPDHMFGTAFATMATATFLFSPMWGRISDKYGKIPTMGITATGYALGQVIFGISSTWVGILIGRFVAGGFMGGFTVTSMAYVVDFTTEKNRSRYLAYLAAGQTLSGSFGYLVGGLIGDHSISACFVAQVAVIVTCCAVMQFILAEPQTERHPSLEKASINPFKALMDARKVLTAPMLVFLVSVFFTSFASMAHDNAFNYFMKAELNFPPSYNGLVKAVIGLIALTANFTVNMWLAAHTNLRKSIIAVLSICAAMPFVCVMMNSAFSIVVANIIFFAFNAVWLPMQQTLAAQNASAQSSGSIAGLYTAAKSLGMIGGPLFAGFVYAYNSKLPFVASGTAFAIAAVICVVNYRQFQKAN